MVIDLDVEPASPPPVRPHRRRYALIAVSALLVVLLGGAAPLPSARLLEPVLDFDDWATTSVVLSGTALYTQRAGEVEGRTEITARPLRPGGPDWTVEVPAAGAELLLDDSQSVLVSAAGDAGQTTFVDARTGAVRWRVPDYATVQVVGGWAAVWRPTDPGTGRLELHDLATGRRLWSRPVVAYAADPRRGLVVTLDERVAATVYAVSDGNVVTGRRALGVEWGVEFPPPFAPARVVGDRLVVFGSSFVAGFRLDDLSLAWRTSTVTPFEVRDCDGQLCAFSAAGLTVFDPAGGAVRWIGDRWRGIADDRTLLDATGRAARVDFATGRVLLELGRGIPLGPYMLRDGDGRFTVVRIADGRVLGSVPAATQGACAAAAEYLGCQTLGGQVTVWRVRD